MIFRIRKAFFVMIVVVLTVVGMSTISVSAATKYTNSSGYVQVKCGSYSKKFTAKKYKNNFSAAFQKALDVAGDLATDSIPAKVTVEKGYYNLDRTLRIYSNTTLVANGCFFRHYGLHLRNGFDDRSNEGYGYKSAKNITVKGGTWDACETYSMAGSTNTSFHHSTFRFGHMNNLVVKGCTFKNNFNCHDIELAGVSGARIVSNFFYNDHDVNDCYFDGGKESVQLDSNTSDSMPFFPSYDKTPCKNIRIRYNSFKNKFRGVGSHHAVLGQTYDNISVYNNTFENIGSIAVYAVYWTNSHIYSNTMKNVGLGVDVRSMTTGSGLNFINPDDVGFDSADEIQKNSSTYIYDNKIILRRENNTYNRHVGVRVMGDYYGADDNETGSKAGTYKIYNVHIGTNENSAVLPNRISGNIEAGIQLNYGVDCEIVNNTVNLSNTLSTAANAIEVKGSENSVISSNRVVGAKNPGSRGIVLSYTAANVANSGLVVNSNTTKGFDTAGFFLNRCTGTTLENNISLECVYSGVTIRESWDTDFRKNTVKNIEQNCIYASASVDGLNIEGNKIKTTPIGLRLGGSENVSVKSNKFTDLSKYGIYAYGSNSDAELSLNKFNNVDTAFLLNSADNFSLTGNELSSVNIGALLKSTNAISIIENNFNTASYSVEILNGADNTMIKSNNFVTENECVYLNGTSDKGSQTARTLTVTENYLDSPIDKAGVRVVYNSINAHVYDNFRTDEESPFYRFKGEGQSDYTKVKKDIKITALSAESADGALVLKWKTTKQTPTYYRIFKNSELESILVGETTDETYSELLDEESYSYTVVTVLEVGNVNYLGSPMTVQSAPVETEKESE